LKEQHLAAAPFGAWQVRFCSFKGRVAQVGHFEEAIPMLTHGSDCQRACLPVIALVEISVYERKRSIGTLPTLIT
jgi:hypothetical protein